MLDDGIPDSTSRRFPVRLTYNGGPTAIIERGGVRMLTDPTFDPAPRAYALQGYSLTKLTGPAIDADAIGVIDLVLLSHDHHADNLDTAGRAVAAKAGLVITTSAGASRLGANAAGLDPWMSRAFTTITGRVLRIEAMPARHGPADGDRGPVIGFMLSCADDPSDAVYISGDTVWYAGTEEIARRYQSRIAILFLGAARVTVAGPSPLTLTAEDAVRAARRFGDATIIPLHFDGWEHFSESRTDVERRIRESGLSSRVRWPEPGVAMDVR